MQVALAWLKAHYRQCLTLVLSVVAVVALRRFPQFQTEELIGMSLLALYGIHLPALVYRLGGVTPPPAPPVDPPTTPDEPPTKPDVLQRGRARLFLGVVAIVAFGIALLPGPDTGRQPSTGAPGSVALVGGCTPRVINALEQAGADTASCVVRQVESGAPNIEAVLGSCAGATAADVVKIIEALLSGHPGADPDANTHAKAQYADMHHLLNQAKHKAAGSAP